MLLHVYYKVILPAVDLFCYWYVVSLDSSWWLEVGVHFLRPPLSLSLYHCVLGYLK